MSGDRIELDHDTYVALVKERDKLSDFYLEHVGEPSYTDLLAQIAELKAESYRPAWIQAMAERDAEIKETDALKERLVDASRRTKDLLLRAAILDWVLDALAGNGADDFGESFGEVAAALAVRKTLEEIAEYDASGRGAVENMKSCARQTLNMLGNYTAE